MNQKQFVQFLDELDSTGNLEVRVSIDPVRFGLVGSGHDQSRRARALLASQKFNRILLEILDGTTGKSIEPDEIGDFLGVTANLRPPEWRKILTNPIFPSSDASFFLVPEICLVG